MTKNNRYLIIIFTLITTLAFHVFFPTNGIGNILGLNFPLFTLIFIALILILRLASDKRSAMWPLWLCVPIIWYAGSIFVYESQFIHAISFLATIFLTGLFLFWFAPDFYPLKTIKNILPIKEITNFALSCLKKIAAPWNELIKSSKGSAREEKTKKIILGIIISIPFVFIFGLLFIKADLLYQEWIHNIFDFDLDETLSLQLFRDLIILLLSGGVFYAFISHPRFRETKVEEFKAAAAEDKPKDNLITTIFLSILNLFFLTFIVAQFIFLFAGHEIINQRGITYAEYVHQGFFQLTFVTFLVLLISYIIYRKKENHKIDRVVALTSLFILQTMVIVASALKRMWLYQEAYGLTNLRFIVWHFIIYLALILLSLAILILIKKNYHAFIKIGLVISIIYLMFMTGINMEEKIAKTNIDRYFANQENELDVTYLTLFSADAYEQIIRLEPEIEKHNQKMLAEGYTRIDMSGCWLKNYRYGDTKITSKGTIVKDEGYIWDSEICPPDTGEVNWAKIEQWLEKQQKEKNYDDYHWQQYTVYGWKILNSPNN